MKGLEPCPGWDHFRDKAKRTGDLEGGITIVNEEGSYLFIPFTCAPIRESKEYFAYLLGMAANKLVKEIGVLLPKKEKP